MTLLIDLTPQAEAWLDALAKLRGTRPAEVVQHLVNQHALLTADNQTSGDPTLAQFAKWEREDAGKSQQQIAQESAVWEEFERGINASRREQGMREL